MGSVNFFTFDLLPASVRVLKFVRGAWVVSAVVPNLGPGNLAECV